MCRSLAAIVCLAALQGTGWAAEGSSACLQEQAQLAEAKALYQRHRFDEAAERAGEIQRSPGCDEQFVQAQGVRSRVWCFEQRAYTKCIAAARQGLEVDPRQTKLWFSLGYAQYQLDSYDEAVLSFQQVLEKQADIPVSDEISLQTHYLIADAIDRGVLKSSPEDAVSLKKAVAAWHGFIGVCNSHPSCTEDKLQRAEQRIRDLEELAGR